MQHIEDRMEYMWFLLQHLRIDFGITVRTFHISIKHSPIDFVIRKEQVYPMEVKAEEDGLTRNRFPFCMDPKCYYFGSMEKHAAINSMLYHWTFIPGQGKIYIK